MKKFGIIGCGWLGSRIANHLSDQYEMYVTTTSEEKKASLSEKGYHVTVVRFDHENISESMIWEISSQLDAVIIAVPFSGRREPEVQLAKKRDALLQFLGDFKGKLFLMSTTSIYPQIQKIFTEEDAPPDEISSECFILRKFPKTHILRLGGLMGGDRLLRKYNISNTHELVNHVHYKDICRAIELMMKSSLKSLVYNLVAPLHPSKEEVISAQNNMVFTSKRAEKGRIISSQKVQNELGFEFEYPDPRYFHTS